MEGAAFLRGVVQAFPYRIRRVLTDNGVAFTPNASTKWDLSRHLRPRLRRARDRTQAHQALPSLDQRPGREDEPHGQEPASGLDPGDATTKAFHYNTADDLRAHVLAFVSAYNVAKHLKALLWRTPFQAICDAWKADPSVFKINPHHLTPGPHT